MARAPNFLVTRKKYCRFLLCISCNEVEVIFEQGRGLSEIWRHLAPGEVQIRCFLSTWGIDVTLSLISNTRCEDLLYVYIYTNM